MLVACCAVEEEEEEVGFVLGGEEGEMRYLYVYGIAA